MHPTATVNNDASPRRYQKDSIKSKHQGHAAWWIAAARQNQCHYKNKEQTYVCACACVCVWILIHGHRRMRGILFDHGVPMCRCAHTHLAHALTHSTKSKPSLSLLSFKWMSLFLKVTFPSELPRSATCREREKPAWTASCPITTFD